MTEQKTTNVIGYFNPNDWPVSLDISSECNRIIRVDPKQFVEDDQGNKINDPVLEAYVGKCGLSREESHTPVPIRFMARILQRDGSAHSVMTAKEFKTVRGNTVPIMEKRPERPAAPVSTNPVKAMPMEVARKLGFVRRTAIVPEDYGAPETDRGATTDGRAIPEIKYAVDVGPRIKPPKDIPEDVARRANKLAENLQKVQAPSESELMAEGADQPFEPEVGPEPDLESEKPTTDVPEHTWTCPLDGKTFKFRPWLLNHCKQVHPDQVDAIMAKFPTMPKKRPSPSA